MPRPGASTISEDRVSRLIALLFTGVGETGHTVADVARSAGLGHETVRSLWRNPSGKERYGPGFFIVAGIARARGLSLDELARSVMVESPNAAEA